MTNCPDITRGEGGVKRGAGRDEPLRPENPGVARGLPRRGLRFGEDPGFHIREQGPVSHYAR